MFLTPGSEGQTISRLQWWVLYGELVTKYGTMSIIAYTTFSFQRREFEAVL